MPNEPTEEFSPEIRAAFDDYPFPVADADFDARFWRELDTRQSRYRGFGGLLRRLIEVEIEGIAVWRLGVALFGVRGELCGLGVALLKSEFDRRLTPTTKRAELSLQLPIEFRRRCRVIAREIWDARDYASTERRLNRSSSKPKAKEEIFMRFIRSQKVGSDNLRGCGAITIANYGGSTSGDGVLLHQLAKPA